ncbi:hypothetical protein [uncultured Eudoraea sp.]|uniref:hypothetical protein n=1 Tax=uncultured Eudoraea sp. TaxID=1035614 RepID=UPI00260F2B04|nr:hypothetical protein [uncultured Eudoraea sp.]
MKKAHNQLKSLFASTIIKDDEVSGFFENIPIKEKALKYFDFGHILPNDYKLDAIRWITKHSHTSN